MATAALTSSDVPCVLVAAKCDAPDKAREINSRFHDHVRRNLPTVSIAQISTSLADSQKQCLLTLLNRVLAFPRSKSHPSTWPPQFSPPVGSYEPRVTCKAPRLSTTKYTSSPGFGLLSLFLCTLMTMFEYLTYPTRDGRVEVDHQSQLAWPATSDAGSIIPRGITREISKPEPVSFQSSDLQVERVTSQPVRSTSSHSVRR